MLRISVNDEPDTVTFKLEGRLAGCLVRELEDCYERTMPARPEMPWMSPDCPPVKEPSPLRW